MLQYFYCSLNSTNKGVIDELAQGGKMWQLYKVTLLLLDDMSKVHWACNTGEDQVSYLHLSINKRKFTKEHERDENLAKMISNLICYPSMSWEVEWNKLMESELVLGSAWRMPNSRHYTMRKFNISETVWRVHIWTTKHKVRTKHGIKKETVVGNIGEVEIREKSRVTKIHMFLPMIVNKKSM